jgi:hypothetical protein
MNRITFLATGDMAVGSFTMLVQAESSRQMLAPAEVIIRFVPGMFIRFVDLTMRLKVKDQPGQGLVSCWKCTLNNRAMR